MDLIDANKVVFISGLHRSGTSIFHRLLREHPAASGFENTNVHEDEGQHLQTVFKPAREYGGLGAFAYHQKARLNESDADALSKDEKLRLNSEWATHWDLTKQVLVEKSPPTIIRAKYFQRLFPGSRFIFLIRHPIPVSYATKRKRKEKTIPELMFHWAYAHALFLEDLPSIEKALVIRYEDFTANPLDTQNIIHEFLALKPCSRKEATNNSNQHYFDSWEDEKKICQPIATSLGRERSVASHFGYTFEKPYVLPWQATATGKSPKHGS